VKFAGNFFAVSRRVEGVSLEAVSGRGKVRSFVELTAPSAWANPQAESEVHFLREGHPLEALSMNASKLQLRPLTRFGAMGCENVAIDLLQAKTSVVDKEPSARPTVT